MHSMNRGLFSLALLAVLASVTVAACSKDEKKDDADAAADGAPAEAAAPVAEAAAPAADAGDGATTPLVAPVVRPVVKVAPPAPKPEPAICTNARNARARNSPAAPGLEAQCRAQGGTP
jgi:hypothetical protein